MVIAPIHVPIPGKPGSKPAQRSKFAERAKLARRVEQCINGVMEGREVHVFHYAEIADQLHTSIEAIRELLFAVDAGYGGITVCTREYWDREIATKPADPR